MRTAVLTISTTLAAGAGEDRSGPRLAELLTEAGCAVLSASRQNKAWDVAAALFRAQENGGDWVNMGVLRRIGSRIRGLKVSRFLSGAQGTANYSQLNAIRTEAKRAGVTVTPAFVVSGPDGTRVVQRPKNAATVIAAIKSVQ